MAHVPPNRAAEHLTLQVAHFPDAIKSERVMHRAPNLEVVRSDLGGSGSSGCGLRQAISRS